MTIRKTRPVELVLTLLSCMPAAYFVSAGSTRFLSWDESYIFYDIVNFRTSPVSQWSFGAFRTSITLWGPLFSAIQSLTHITKDVTLVLAKALHLITGVGLITITIDQTQSCFFPKTRQGLFHAVLFNATMFLPVTSLALKTLNYDMLSMLLGVLGSVLCIAGTGYRNKLKLFSGIIILTLAAHEKLIASPLLWIGMIASVCVLSWPLRKCTFTTFVTRIILWSLSVPALSLLIIVLSFTFVIITHGPSGPVFSAQQILLAYSLCLWPLCNLLHIGSTLFTTTLNTSLCSEIILVLKGFCIITCIVFSVCLTLVIIFRIITSRKLYTIIPRINTIVAKLNFVILFIITITGVIASYTLNTKIWPLLAVPDGHYIPSATFNDIAFHFGAKTSAGHSLFSVAWACAVYTNAIPTVLLFLLLLGTIRKLRSPERYAVNSANLLLNLFTLLCISAPVLYGILQLPLYSRYFNLFLLGSVLSLIPQSIKWNNIDHKLVLLLCNIGFFFLFIESYPFQPFTAAFHPFWSNCSSIINKHPSFGNVTPWYPGWGEELPEAFERITRKFSSDTHEIRLYHNFPSALIRPPANVTTSAMPEGHGKLPYRYSDHDFYILSRNGVSTYSYIAFPQNVHPLFTIENRGFIKAWVFRGSDLYRNGFSFGKDTMQ
ncbi:MAG TPA: hypothetical protein VHO70_05115 [Chitinispirillaceae bacterium]|nr:hypothetical protein [Chitinispirillaceae bacterium]